MLQTVSVSGLVSWCQKQCSSYDVVNNFQWFCDTLLRTKPNLQAQKDIAFVKLMVSVALATAGTD